MGGNMCKSSIRSIGLSLESSAVLGCTSSCLHQPIAKKGSSAGGCLRVPSSFDTCGGQICGSASQCATRSGSVRRFRRCPCSWSSHPLMSVVGITFGAVPALSFDFANFPDFRVRKGRSSKLIKRKGFTTSFSRMASGDHAASVLPPVKFRQQLNFCSSCGGAIVHKVPVGEQEIRAVCSACGVVHYQNPKMVVGCLVEHEDKVLLCRRSIQPSHGLWTLPAGYMELGESAAEGAVRETWEEAQAEVQILGLFAHLDIPLIGQSYIIFRAQLKKPHFSPGVESLECALFRLNEIPFGRIAFSSITETLKMYVEDIRAGHIKVHHGVIDKRPGTSPSDPEGYVVRDHLCM